MLIGSMVHRPDEDVLLAFALLVSGTEEFFLSPRWNGAVTVCHVSSEEECTKRWKIAALRILVIGPIGRSDLAFNEDLLGTCDACAVDQCPCVVLTFAKRRWHLELAGLW